MAFVANMSDDQEQKLDQGTPTGGAVSPSGGGGAVRLSPSSAVSPAGGGGAGNAPTPAAGGQFASLQNYLSANQGQAEPLAGKLTSGIGRQYDTLQGQNASTLADINKQVASNAIPGASDTLAQEAANPVSFASNQSNIPSFQKLLGATYSGPASAESTPGFQAQQAALNKAITAGTQATTTEAGRENLLSQNEATPTTGVTALNSAILSQSPEALGSVESAYKPFSNLVTGLNQGAQDVNKNIAQTQGDLTSANAAANKQIADQINALNTGVAGGLTAAQQNATTQNAALKADLAAGTPSPADLQVLGITSDQWNALSAADKAAATSQVVSNGQFQANTGTATIDPTQWLTQQDPNAVYNAGNVATADQYAKAQAFQNLLNGMNLPTPAPTLAINPSSASQAGTAPTNLNQYDYQTALNTAQSTAATEKAAAQAYVDALQAGATEAEAQAAAANRAKIQTGLNLSSVASTPVGASIAAGKGIANAGQNYASNITSSNPTQIAANVASMGLIPAGQAVASGIQNAVSTVTNMFCFHPWTSVEMANGSTRPIAQIRVGDETRGGLVLATTRSAATEFYWYSGVLVTGKHAVKENGKWTRVENSKEGRRFPCPPEVVCNLVTEKHRIWASGIEFADEWETDLYESLDLNESLAEMNRNEPIR